MRFLELRLLKYGDFENQTLQFGDGAGLHIIYGLNEAGKSTALRAIKSFLFGIPDRTTDNFNYDYDVLRIGAVLQHSKGEQQTFIRRKGKKSLLSESGAQVDPAVLQKYLMGIDEATFSLAFGIDHLALERGSKRLLEQHGEVGLTLFSARMGGDVRAVLEELKEKAGGLYKDKAQNPLLNKALRDYEEQRQAARKLSVPSKQYLECREDLDNLEKDRLKLDEELRVLGTQRARLERLLKALPYLEQRKELLQRRQEMGAVLVLREDFAAERKRTEASLRENEARAKTLIEKQRRLQERIDGLQVRTELLEQERAIRKLQQDLGVYEKAKPDLPRLKAQADAARAAAEAILRELRPGMSLAEVDSLHLAAAKKTRIQALGISGQALQTKFESLAKDVKELAADLQSANEAHARCKAPPDKSVLEAALRRAQSAGDLESELARATRKSDTSGQQLQREFQRLRFWAGSLDALLGLRVPAPETLARFERCFKELDKQQDQLEPQLRANQARAEELRRKLEDLRRGGTIPSEEDLRAARAHRERGWALVRRAWLDGQEDPAQAGEFDPELKLPEAYEKSVRSADDVADGLRRDANRVAQQQNTLRDMQRDGEELGALEKERDRIAAERAQCQTEWEELWRVLGVQAGDTGEMKAWLEAQKGLLKRDEEHRELRERVSIPEQAIKEHKEALAAGLRGLGEQVAEPAALSALLSKSVGVLDSISDRTNKRAALENKAKELGEKLPKKERERDEARKKLEKWQEDWGEAMGWLGVPGTASPAEANAFLNELDGLFSNLEEHRDKLLRVTQITEFNSKFAADVTALTARVARDLVNAPAEQAADTLNTHLDKAKKDNTTRTMTLEEVKGVQEELEGVQKELEALHRKRDALYAEAHCTDETKIEELEKRSAAFVSCQKEIQQKEEHLSLLGPVGELSAEAEGVNRDALPADIEAQTRAIREKEASRQTLSDDMARKKHDLGLMDGGAKAAEAAQQAQFLLGQIRTEAESYLRLRLAALLLGREIEQYRKENEGPLVTRTSKLFSQLTRGAFNGVRTDAGDDGQTVLAAVRNVAQAPPPAVVQASPPALGAPASSPAVELPVEKLSSGTRDQLYLALHLAQFPGAFIVPPGEEGGRMTNGGNFGGTLAVGDQNLWSFTANAGDNVVLRLGSSGFEGFLV
ncbi:MAG: AAA family ATPase, partial [Planctomycetota bacterium]